MFHFTIRDVLWLTAVAGLSIASWVNHRGHQQQIETMKVQAEQLKSESRVWENRAQALRLDVMTGSNKNTEIEFIPNGVRYRPKE
jgi:hypothetical protein